jgi:hypothetical protein
VIDAEHPAIVIQEIAERKRELPSSELEKGLLNVQLVNRKWELIQSK